MPKKPTTQKQLLLELEDLRARLEEAEDTLRAIRSGEVDALVVPGEGGDQIFTLKGADHSYRLLIEDMNEGALTLTMDGVILYANRRFAEMLKTPLEKVIGSMIHTWIAPEGQRILQSLLRKDVDERRREELVLAAGDGTPAPVNLSVSNLLIDEMPDSFCLVATDLTEQKRSDAIAAASEKLARELLAASNESRLALQSEIEDRKKAEEELRASKAQLSNALEMAHLGHWEYDVANDLFTFNDQFYKIFRTTVEKVGGYTMHSAGYAHRFVHPDDMDVVGEETRKAIETTDPHFNRQIEHRMLYPDGTVGYIAVRFFIVKNSHGRTVKTYGVNQDITERKQAEEALKESEEWNKVILRTVLSGVIMIDAITRKIVEVNDTALKLIGLPGEQVIGFVCHKFICPAEENNCPILDLGKTVDSSERVLLTAEGKRKNIIKTVVPVELRGRKYLIESFVDITERKKAEEGLRVSEENFRRSLEESPLGVRVVSAEGETLYVNRTTLDIFGCDSIEEWQTTPTVKRYTEQSYAEFKVRRKKRRLDKDASPEYEIDIVRKDGEVRHLYVWRTRVLWNGKEHYQLRYSDITDSKRSKKQLQETLDSLRRAIGATIQVMVSAVETRDPYTSGHQIRSADLARAIATEMGLPQEKIDAIRMAGSIHDIGKIAVPAEILSKPTKLRDFEFRMIMFHAQAGYDILKDIEFPWPLAEIVYQHHERMDGSGYPRNLKGEEICIEARILAVADVVEAMASHRPYRPALGIDAALKEIENNRGTHYDIDVVDACLRKFREQGFQLEGD